MAGLLVDKSADWQFRDAGFITDAQEIDDLKWTGLADVKCDNCDDKCKEPLRVTIREKATKDCRDMYICRYCVSCITIL